jgi:hypothetical protein
MTNDYPPTTTDTTLPGLETPVAPPVVAPVATPVATPVVAPVAVVPNPFDRIIFPNGTVTPSEELYAVLPQRARNIAYTLFIIAAIALGATVAYFVATSEPIPHILYGVAGVLTFLGIPGFGLALANPRKTP